MAHVEDHSRAEAPVERHLVDPPGRLALGRRAVVIGRIDVRGRVAANRQVLHRPAVPVRVDEVLRRGAEGVHHALEATRVVRDVFDLRLGPLAGRIVFERHAQVDELKRAEARIARRRSLRGRAIGDRKADPGGRRRTKKGAPAGT